MASRSWAWLCLGGWLNHLGLGALWLLCDQASHVAPWTSVTPEGNQGLLQGLRLPGIRRCQLREKACLTLIR